MCVCACVWDSWMPFVFRSHVRGCGFDVAMRVLIKTPILRGWSSSSCVCLTCPLTAECAVDLLESPEIRISWCVWVITCPELQCVTVHLSHNEDQTTALLFLAMFLARNLGARSRNTACVVHYGGESVEKLSSVTFSLEHQVTSTRY
jgi:hypothetical protein